ncbi:hypothetical protein AVL50_30620 [Flammeovirga sp. SJP92]|nr:hypothetical protein AVL50_30620 [Flammeovirga sp. SJP92]
MAFKDHIDTIPKGYKGPKFVLRKNYPIKVDSTLYKSEKEKCKWLNIPLTEKDFNSAVKKDNGQWPEKWDEYASSIKQYLVSNLKLEKNGIAFNNPYWYNLPWLATNPYSGREFTHGARYSFPIPITQLVPSAKSKATVSVWGIAHYNYFGGLALGQVWSEYGDLQYMPAPNGNRVKGLPFLDGTVIHKVNIIGHLGDYTPEHLKNAPSWELNIHKNAPGTGAKTYERTLQKAHILEMDVMVKDSRSPCGWVFCALVYNDDVPYEKPLWERYEIMGIQFGMDPESFPAVPITESKPIHQTLLKPISEKWTVGCYGRLVTFQGSTSQNCMGCHQTSYSVKGTPSRGFALLGGLGKESCDTTSYKTYPNYFKNWKFPSVYDGTPMFNTSKDSLVGYDFSLRLFDAVESYEEYKVQ